MRARETLCHPEKRVILSEAKDLLFGAKSRSFASLRMTNY
jgi:hypothetical protein